MKSAMRHIILRSCLIVAMVLQSVMPAAYAMAQEAGHDVSALICNPSNKAPSAQAQAHMETLLGLLNEQGSEGQEEAAHEHCSSCILQFASLITAPQIALITTRFAFDSTSCFRGFEIDSSRSREPPLGGRAPPIFL